MPLPCCKTGIARVGFKLVSGFPFPPGDIIQLLDLQLRYWEKFDWDSIWLMGAAGFLFVIRECFEHVTEHGCHRCTSLMNGV